jgi:probable poly-beta-1,6-N-acetyl-D-glucosamine export protein
MPMIALVYLITPLFYAWRNSPWLYVFTVVGLGLTLFTTRPVGNLNPFLALVHFAGVFALGIVMSKHAAVVDRMTDRQAWLWMLAGVLVFVLAAVLYPGYRADWTFTRQIGQLNTMELGKLGLLITAFVGFEKFFNRRNAVMSYIASISFGLYFIHGFFMGAFDNLTKHMVLPDHPAMILGDVVVMMVLSFATVALLKKLLGQRSRYVMGC